LLELGHQVLVRLGLNKISFNHGFYTHFPRAGLHLYYDLIQNRKKLFRDINGYSVHFAISLFLVLNEYLSNDYKKNLYLNFWQTSPKVRLDRKGAAFRAEYLDDLVRNRSGILGDLARAFVPDRVETGIRE
jgi:hypothetical protein